VPRIEKIAFRRYFPSHTHGFTPVFKPYWSNIFIRPVYSPLPPYFPRKKKSFSLAFRFPFT